MNRTDLLERLQAANPVPGTEHVDPDELVIVFSAIEERRGIVTTTKTPVPTRTIPPPRRRRAALAFVAALALVLLVIGAAIVVLGGEQSAEVGTQTSATAGGTTTPGEADQPGPAVSGPGTPTTGVVEPGMVPFVLELSDRPELGTRMALDQNGMPVLVSLTVEPGAETGMVRLFRFDEEYEPEVIELYESERSTQPVEVAVGPAGDVYVLHIGSTQETDLMVFHSGELIDLPEVFEHDAVGDYVTAWPITFDGAGNPVIMDFRLGAGEMQDELALIVCSDPFCSSHERIVVDEASSLSPDDELVVEGDRVRIRYVTGSLWREATVGLGDFSVTLLPDATRPEPEPVSAWPENVFDPGEYLGAGHSAGLEGANIQLATCLDPGCAAQEVTTVATTGGWAYMQTLNLEVAPDGTIYLAIAVEDHGAELGYDDRLGLRLHVFPHGELGAGVEPLEGFVEAPGWPAL